MNDQNFVLSMLTLEELGATGNKVCLLCVMLFGLGLLWPCVMNAISCLPDHSAATGGQDNKSPAGLY